MTGIVQNEVKKDMIIDKINSEEEPPCSEVKQSSDNFSNKAVKGFNLKQTPLLN